MERTQISRAANLGAGKELDHVGAGSDCGHDFGRRESAGDGGNLRASRHLHNCTVKAGARYEHRAGVKTPIRGRYIEHRTGADDRIGMTSPELSHDLGRIGNGHSYFHDGNASSYDRLGGEKGVFFGGDANGGHNSDFANTVADFVFRHLFYLIPFRLGFFFGMFGLGQRIVVARRPDIESGQQEDAEQQCGYEPAHDHDGERPLRIRPDAA